jgi:hypothetical protein
MTLPRFALWLLLLVQLIAIVAVLGPGGLSHMTFTEYALLLLVGLLLLGGRTLPRIALWLLLLVLLILLIAILHDL